MTHTLIDIPTLQTLVEYATQPMTRGDRTIHSLAGAIATAEELLADPIKPAVVCNITGGVLQGASSDYPIDVYCLDFDTDGANDDETVEIDGGRCHATEVETQVDSLWVADVIQTIMENDDDLQ